ncbi:hypothetical protein BBJ28_00001845 [Nothophytophthora sp. Chile5]|nr:hypothetical protein BBJ28_00001845 [Nothophytophthora sp. Chile5]
MPPHKGGGGKKKGGAKKRKANVWDDAEPKAKRGAAGADAEPRPRQRGGKSGSMFGQWKQQKQAALTKQRTFFGSVGEKKRWQREQYEQVRERTANAIYVADKAEKPSSAASKATRKTQDRDETSDSDSEEDEEMDGKTRGSLFAQFVRTFQPAAASEKEDEEEEEEYEEVLVDADGQEIDAEGEDEEEATGEDAEDQAAEEEAAVDEEEDDEELPEEAEEQEEQEDRYRRRYVLSSFSTEDARAFDGQQRKFESVKLPQLADAATYDVSYRSGASSSLPGVAGVAMAPDAAQLTKPYVRGRLLSAWKQRGLDVETAFPAVSVERTLFQQLSGYSDVFFAGQTYENTPTLRRLSAMHVLNHVLKARDTVVRNNERIRRRESSQAEAQDDEEKEYRDQGFCRPSVLVLLPLRSAALAFVKELLALLPANMDTFHNKERFFSEYGSAKDEDDDEETAEDDGKKEWQSVFAAGNNDDCFQLGLSFSRKALRFYSAYHNADIIVASPLGLRQQLGDEAAVLDEMESSSQTDVKLSSDFLSAIEVCVVDSASLVAMQNLEHLRTILRALNTQPKEAPHADFARVREWNLASLGAYFRQTVVFAHGVEPTLNSLMNKTCRNVAGVVKFVRRYEAADGSASISRVVPQVKQIFQRVDLEHAGRLAAKDEVELRFEYFKKHVFEPLLDHPRKHVLIFIPSYFDYVRVRNLFGDSMNKKLIRSGQCCEYTTNQQVSRARTSFFHGKCHVLLFTERFHFYHQYHIRGVHQLIWYGLPVMGDFYAEMLNMLPTGEAHEEHDGLEASSLDGKSSIALFTRLDLLRMQRIVGNKRAERMCQPKAAKPTFLFC